MLVYLFLWFYLSANHICNGLQILTESEGKSSSRKYRNPDRGFKQHIVAHSPKSLPDALTDQEMPLVNINDLLSQLRDNWEAPSTYLEKRGYLTKKRSDKKHKEHHNEHSSQEHDNGGKSFKDQLKKYHERKNAHLKSSIEKEESVRRDTSKTEPNKRLTNSNKFFYFPHTSNKIKKESQNGAKVPCTTTSSPTTDMVVGTCPPKTDQLGIMTRLRNSFRSLFKPSKTYSWKDDLNMYSDIMNEESADNLNTKKTKQKVSNFRFDDDTWLNRDSSDDFLVEKRSYDYVIPPLGDDNIAEGDPSLCGGSSAQAPQAPPTNCAASAASSPDLSIKFADVLKNLTQADIDYVKNFLKCYRENKEKFYVDYLHMNKTMINETSNGGGPTAQDARNNNSPIEKNNTEGMIKCQPDAKKPKTALTTNKSPMPIKKVDSGSKESQSTTPAAGKEDDTVKVDIDLRTNDTGPGAHKNCTPLKRKIPANGSIACAKLKFLQKQKPECKCTQKIPSSTVPSIEQSNEGTSEMTTQPPEETTIEPTTEETTTTQKTEEPITIQTTEKSCTKCQSKSHNPSKIAHKPTPATVGPGTPQSAILGANSSTTDLEFKLNDTSNDDEDVQGYDPFANKLKFLAHSHHTVDQVGKRPHKHLDLKRVQEMIDGARLTLATGGIGMEDESNNDTKCTPIRLNEVSLDVEWSSQDDNDSQNQPFGGCLTFSTNGEKPFKGNDDLFSMYSKDSSNPQKSQFSTSDSDNPVIPSTLSKYSLPKVRYNSEYLMFDPNKKKREVALPENNEEEAAEEEAPASEDYSELLPSLSVFGSSRKRPLPLDEYIEDYNLGLSRSAKSTGGGDNEDYDYDDGSTDDNELLGRKKKKKRKQKKKYNKKSSNQNHQPFDNRDDPSEFVPEDQDVSPPETDDLGKSNNDFFNFPELSDIKFHVSSDQEEDIEKFIASLNAPPEVFSFDVEKFLKPKITSEPIAFDNPPAKTFYEFVGAPRIENEQVPFIVPDSSESLTLPDVAVETLAKENRNYHPKRDILRQYIKGISEQLANRPPYRAATDTSTFAQSSEQNGDAPNDAVPVDRSEAFMTNYANDLDVLNYERYEQPAERNTQSANRNAQSADRYAQPVPIEVGADDFIDKFYLLNDGSYSLYGSRENAARQKGTTNMDPTSLGIDLDLNEKFKDLTLHSAESKVPVEKELDLTKHPVNNLDMVYIPDSVYHRAPSVDKMSDWRPLPLNLDNNHS